MTMIVKLFVTLTEGSNGWNVIWARQGLIYGFVVQIAVFYGSLRAGATDLWPVCDLSHSWGCWWAVYGEGLEASRWVSTATESSGQEICAETELQSAGFSTQEIWCMFTDCAMFWLERDVREVENKYELFIQSRVWQFIGNIDPNIENRLYLYKWFS